MSLSETFKLVDTKSRYFGYAIFLLIFMSARTTWALVMPADTIDVIAKHPESSAGSIYQINFTLTKSLPPKAIIRVTFPAEFDLSALLIAGSTTINGGFEIKVENQVVTLKRSGLGREIPANEQVDVKFAIVNNPRQPGDQYKLVVEVLDENEKLIVRREKLQKVLPQKE